MLRHRSSSINSRYNKAQQFAVDVPYFSGAVRLQNGH